MASASAEATGATHVRMCAAPLSLSSIAPPSRLPYFGAIAFVCADEPTDAELLMLGATLREIRGGLVDVVEDLTGRKAIVVGTMNVQTDLLFLRDDEDGVRNVVIADTSARRKLQTLCRRIREIDTKARFEAYIVDNVTDIPLVEGRGEAYRIGLHSSEL